MEVSDALKMYDEYRAFWDDNYREARTDLNFSIGKDHWDESDVLARKKAGKPSLVINELPQFIHQVTNDIRQNTPSISVLPETDGDMETSDIFRGLIRSIEYKSAADEVYDTAVEYSVKCSIGFIRVDHDYVDDETDEQELLLRRVPDPLSVYLDPSSLECDGRDADGAICLESITKAQFETLYPGKEFCSFTDPKVDSSQDASIVIAEIFVREHTYETRKERRRKTSTTVRRFKFSGKDMLAETTFPGKYIPVVPVIGEEIWIDGKRILSSLIRQARDPSRRLNHWASKEAEILGMAPIAPVMAALGSLANENGEWQSPGTSMVLQYHVSSPDGTPYPQPTRLNPPPIPTGIINAMQGAKENIKESMGLYNASIGNRSNETSGVAINARKVEGDVATFHFGDNLRRSITQVGRILVDAIPVVYDTPRIIQIIGDEDEPKAVGINGHRLAADQKEPYDLTKGKYHVRVTTGASYTTKRQEAADFLAQMFKQAPELMQIGGDLLFKNLDLPGAEALAARFKKTIDPKLLDEQGSAQGPDPEKLQMAQIIEQGKQMIVQMEQEILKLQQQLADKGAEMQLKAASEQGKAQSDSMKYQLEQEKIKNEKLKLAVEQKQTEIDAYRAEMEALFKAEELNLRAMEMQSQTVAAQSASVIPSSPTTARIDAIEI